MLSQRASLENQLAEAEEHGEHAVKEARARTRDLEDALQRAKEDMARQLREYQVSCKEMWVEKWKDGWNMGSKTLNQTPHNYTHTMNERLF